MGVVAWRRTLGTHMDAYTLLKLARCAVVVAVMLAAVAMVLYPGGTYLDPAARGYSFLQNSFSDLGSAVSWSGQRNHASPFILAACLSLLLGAGGCFTVLIPIYSSSLGTQRLVRASGAFVLLASLALLAAVATPHDRYPALHGRLTLFAIGSFAVGTAMLAITTRLNARVRRRVAAVWLALTFVVLAWGALIYVRQPTTELQLAIPVTVQKVVGFSLVATLMFQSYEAERFLDDRRSPEPTCLD